MFTPFAVRLSIMKTNLRRVDFVTTTNVQLKSTKLTGNVSHIESGVTTQVGSNESLDILEEDFNRNSKTRATGFIGGNSDVEQVFYLISSSIGPVQVTVPLP